MELPGPLNKIIFLLCVLSICFTSCKEEKPQSIPKAKLVVPKFNADSAYAYIEKQLSFGPRAPGSEGQIQCRDWFVQKLESLGAKVIVQEFKGKIYSGEEKTGYNIIAQIKPKLKNRVLLAAHWDTRLVADKDESRKNEPIMGADDGASGVAALIEIARLLQETPMKNLGIDIILFDLEDQGALHNTKEETNTWTLGSVHWSKNVVPKGYKANFGILLDMIAAKGARFGREGYSMLYAKTYMDKVWTLAQRMGKGHLFQDYDSGGIQDDHVAVNKMGIPMIDIINRPMELAHGFGHYHHTHKDDIDIISKQNLKDVGQVVTTAIYREAVGRF